MAKSSGKRQMEKERLLETYSACLKNATDLVEEARLLLANGHRARAYALAFTAFEEIAKSQIVADFFTGMLSESDLQKLFYSHPEKVKRVQWAVDRAYDYIMDNEQIYTGTRPTFEQRNAALYVGIDSQGTPLTPSKAIDEHAVLEILHAAEVALEEIWRMEEKGEQIGTKGFMK